MTSKNAQCSSRSGFWIFKISRKVRILKQSQSALFGSVTHMTILFVFTCVMSVRYQSIQAFVTSVFWTRPNDRRCMSVRTRTHHGRKQIKTYAVKLLSQDERPVASKFHEKICTATPNKTTWGSTHHKNLGKQRYHLIFSNFTCFQNVKDRQQCNQKLKLTTNELQRNKTEDSQSTEQRYTKLKLTHNFEILYKETDTIDLNSFPCPTW